MHQALQPLHARPDHTNGLQHQSLLACPASCDLHPRRHADNIMKTTNNVVAGVEQAQKVVDSGICPSTCINLSVLEHWAGEQTCFCDPGGFSSGPCVVPRLKA